MWWLSKEGQTVLIGNVLYHTLDENSPKNYAGSIAMGWLPWVKKSNFEPIETYYCTVLPQTFWQMGKLSCTEISSEYIQHDHSGLFTCRLSFFIYR